MLNTPKPQPQAAGATSAGSNREAAGTAEIVVLAVPYAAVDSILPDIDDGEGKILIDVTNRISPDDPASVVDGTSNGSLTRRPHQQAEW